MVLLFYVVHLQAQSIDELKTALVTNGQKIQAIHHYPKNIKDGQCHHVEVTAITINGNQVTITESWSNWLGKKANTILQGKMEGNMATGAWKSNYSSGAWSYNFSSRTGQWNKTRSTFDRFSEWKKLEFTIINAKNIKDGFFDCP